jgi:hypothetical protein
MGDVERDSVQRRKNHELSSFIIANPERLEVCGVIHF